MPNKAATSTINKLEQMGQQLSSLTGNVRSLVQIIWLHIFRRSRHYAEFITRVIVALGVGFGGLTMVFPPYTSEYQIFTIMLGAILTTLMIVYVVWLCVRDFDVASAPLRSSPGVEPALEMQSLISSRQNIESTTYDSERASGEDPDAERRNIFSACRVNIDWMWKEFLSRFFRLLVAFDLFPRPGATSRDETNEREMQNLAARLIDRADRLLTGPRSQERTPLLSSSQSYGTYSPSTSAQGVDLFPQSVSLEIATDESSAQSAESRVEQQSGYAETSFSVMAPGGGRQAQRLASSQQPPGPPPVERLLRSGAEIAASASKSPRKRPLSTVADVKDTSVQLKRTKPTAPLARTESVESQTESSATESQDRTDKDADEEKTDKDADEEKTDKDADEEKTDKDADDEHSMEQDG